MSGKLGIIVDGSGWLSQNIIASIYPQPGIAEIAILDGNGVTNLIGSHTVVTEGTPIIGVGYQTLNAVSAGYKTSINDVTTKTVMILARMTVSGTKRALGIGAYHPGSVPQGDTMILDPVVGNIRAIASTSTGIVDSNSAYGSVGTDKFYLIFGDYKGASVQSHFIKNGVLNSATLSAISNRAIPASTIKVGTSYNPSGATGLDLPLDVAAYGVWPGSVLSSSEKMEIYRTLKDRLGSVISIS